MEKIKLNETPLYEEDELSIYSAEKHNSKEECLVYKYEHLGDIKTYENKIRLLKLMYKNKVKLCKIIHSEYDDTYFYIITEKTVNIKLEDIVKKREDVSKIMVEIGNQVYKIHNTEHIENREIERIKNKIKDKLIDIKQNIISKDTYKLLNSNNKINIAIDYALNYFESNESSKFINISYNGLDDENYIMFNEKNNITTMIGNLSTVVGFVGKDLIQFEEILDSKYWLILCEAYGKNLGKDYKTELDKIIKIGEILKIADKIKHIENTGKVEDIEKIKIIVNKIYYKISNKKYSTEKIDRDEILQDNLDWVNKLTLGDEIEYNNGKTKLNIAYLNNEDTEFVYKIKEIPKSYKYDGINKNIENKIELIYKAIDNGAKIYDIVKITNKDGMIHSLTKRCYGDSFTDLVRNDRNVDKLVIDIVKNTYIINTCEKNIDEEIVKKEMTKINTEIREIKFFLIDLDTENYVDYNYKHIENLYRYLRYVQKNVDISKYMGVIFGDLINTRNIMAIEENGEYRLENFIDVEFIRTSIFTFDIALFTFKNFINNKENRNSVIKMYTENFPRKYRDDIVKLIYFNVALNLLNNIIYVYYEKEIDEDKVENIKLMRILNEGITDTIGGEIENLKSKNVEYETGRICDETGVTSVIISNEYKERLIENVESGVREACVLLLDKGYELMTSCQGHNPNECEFNTRIIGMCVEESEVENLKKKIDNINKENGTTINTSLNKMKKYKLGKLLIKEYINPIRFNILFGEYNKCENNYNIFLKEFK